MIDFNLDDLLSANDTNKQPWSITDDRTADWAMRKIQELDADTAAWKRHYEMLAAKVEQQNEAAKERLMEHLRRYFEMVPHHTTRTQESYALPAGKIGVKAVAPGYVRDDVALLPWVRENHTSLVQVKESVNWVELKKRLTITDGLVVDTETGEIIPGVTAIEGGTKFFVQFAKDGRSGEEAEA